MTRVLLIDDTPQIAELLTFGLRDLSNHWDDAYAGKIQYCLLTIPERTRPIIGPPINP